MSIQTIYSMLSISLSQTFAEASLGIRQSPRGESVTVPTFGPSGRHDRFPQTASQTFSATAGIDKPFSLWYNLTIATVLSKISAVFVLRR